MAVNSRRLTGVMTVAALIAALFVACGDEGEELPESPSIRGEIMSVTMNDNGDISSVLVEGEVEPDTEFDKASLRVDEDTEVLFALGPGAVEEGGLVDLQKGRLVEAWIVGPVAESYPVQGYAGRIVILGD